MKIIRSRLTADALVPPNTRYDATCDCIQVTTDGGTTWVDAVGQDPRHQPAYLFPPVSGSAKQCDAAANMVKWLHDFMDEVIAALTATATAIYLANTIITFVERLLPYMAYFIELAFEAAVDLFGYGAIALDAAFDSTTYDLLLCIFLCNVDSDGRVNAAGLTNIEVAIVDQLPTTAAVIVNEILFITGEVGLSNAGASGSQTGDCSGCTDCGWCYTFDFAAAFGGWAAYPDPARGPNRGFWTGSQWSAVDLAPVPTANAGSHEIMFRILFPASSVVTSVQVNYNRVDGQFSPNGTDEIIMDAANGWYTAGTIYATRGSSGHAGTNQVWTTTGTHTVTTELTVWMFSALRSAAVPTSEGSLFINSVTLRGDGANPFGDNNC
jgi:hypothetical protein